MYTYIFLYVYIQIFKSTWGSSLYLNNTWKLFSIKFTWTCMLKKNCKKSIVEQRSEMHSHHSVFPVRLPSPIIQVLILGLKEVAFHWVLMLPCHCWGEQTASQPVKLYFLATCLKLQLPDMANEFYNQKLKWISCSRCFYSGNYQTFLAAHLSFKRIKLCTSIMCCHWSIAQLYQTFYSGNWINFLQGFFFCVAL